eukprot:gene15301-21386_t
MALEAGELVVTLEFAQGLKDVEVLGKNDPFCIITCGSQQFRSRTIQGGGKNPVWNETFRYNLINENDLAIEVKDEDVTMTTLIGQGRVSLAKVRLTGQDRQQMPVMTKGSKQKGFVSVTLAFSKNSTLQRPAQAHGGPYSSSAYAPMAPAPTPYYAPPYGNPLPYAQHPPPPQYGAPPPGQYGAPAPGQYGAPHSGQYGAPPPGQYGAPPAGQHGAPPPGQYGAPPPGQYGAPAPGQYGAPPPGQYGAPPPGQYGAPPPGQYGAPPPGQYGAPPPQQHGAPPA